MNKTKRAIKYAIDNGLIDVDTETGNVYGMRGHVLKPGLSGTPPNRQYYTVNIPTPEGKQASVQIHRLVAYVVYGNAALEDGVEVDHKDRNKFNSRADNLRLTDRKGNAENVSAFGLDTWNETTIAARITLIENIRSMYIEDLLSPTELARHFDVRIETIYAALHGDSGIGKRYHLEDRTLAFAKRIRAFMKKLPSGRTARRAAAS